MKKSVILLLILGLFLESRPNFFKNFFYTQKEKKLPKNNVLVAEDGFNIDRSEDSQNVYTFSHYKGASFGRQVGEDQGNCMKQFFVKDDGISWQYDFLEEIKIPLDALKNSNGNDLKIENDFNQRPNLDYIRKKDGAHIQKDASQLLNIKENITVTETVLDKTKVALTVFTACLIGYFAQGYVRSGAKAN